MKFRSANREERKMLFPKPQTKKKRKKHRESLLQNKESRICYLCARGGDYSWKQVLEEHHIFGGPNRHLSEEYGLKVYICPECHRTSARAVHRIRREKPTGICRRKDKKHSKSISRD